jgi:predicted nucleotide-binding protein
LPDRLPPALLQRLESRLGLSRSQVNRRIDATARERLLTRRLGGLALARENGISIHRYASQEELTRLAQSSAPPPAAPPTPLRTTQAEIAPRRSQSRRRRTPGRRDGQANVWIVHGRDLRARDEVAIFLRAIGLTPLEYNQALRQTRTGSPHPSTVLERAFATARAVVVLLTPDDEARLRAPFRRASDPAHETRLTPQARPNVLFEAGEAFGLNRAGTILVQVGTLRPFSNVAGLHVVHLHDTPACRQELATKLEAAGCRVDRSGQDWLSAGNFAAVLPRVRPRVRARSKRRHPRR